MSQPEVKFVPAWPAPRAPRFRSLDLWRGAACLAVVVFHSIYYTPYYRSIVAGTPFVAGDALLDRVAFYFQRLLAELWLGVPMFFAISGYCITAAIDAQRRRPADVLRYFARRFRRIYPPYWIAVAGTAATFAICEIAYPEIFSDENAPWSLGLGQWVGNLTLTESWRYHFAAPGQRYFLGVSWTLCYEEQFYALAGLILLVARRRIFAAAFALTVCSLAVRYAAFRQGVNLDGLFVDGRWLQFAAGILLYYRVNYATERQGAAIHAAWGIALLSALVYKDYLPSPLDRSTIISFGLAFFLSMTHRWDVTIAESRWTAPLMYCGKICYSMYLVHWPVCKVVSHHLYLSGWTGAWQNCLITIPLCVTLSAALASLFYDRVEQRFLNAPTGGAAAAPPAERATSPVGSQRASA